MSYEGKLLYVWREKQWVALPKVTDYKVTFCKLWSSDTGRSISGENKGTLIGIFPKLSIKFGQMDEFEMQTFLKVVNGESAKMKYYDPERRETVENSFYFGDAVSELKRKRTLLYKPTEISVIANKRRR